MLKNKTIFCAVIFLLFVSITVCEACEDKRSVCSSRCKNISNTLEKIACDNDCVLAEESCLKAERKKKEAEEKNARIRRQAEDDKRRKAEQEAKKAEKKAKKPQSNEPQKGPQYGGELPKTLTAADYFKSGQDNFNKGDYNQAISDLTKAVELNPKDANSYSWRGISYYNKGDYNQAISDLTKAVELNPKDAGNYHWRGTTYHKIGQYDKAIADLTKAIELNPTIASNYHWRGIAYRSIGKMAEAFVDFLKERELQGIGTNQPDSQKTKPDKEKKDAVHSTYAKEIVSGDFYVRVDNCQNWQGTLTCDMLLRNIGRHAGIGLWSTSKDPNDWSYIKVGQKIYGPAKFKLLDNLPVVWEKDEQGKDIKDPDSSMRGGWSHGGIVNFRPGDIGRFKLKFPNVPQAIMRIDELLIISGTYRYSNEFREPPDTEIIVRGIAIK